MFVSWEQCLEFDVRCDWKSDEQRRDGLSLVGGRVLSSECCGEEGAAVDRVQQRNDREVRNGFGKWSRLGE